jgi:predicted Fe-Mo cluster-binding NifX family protein
MDQVRSIVEAEPSVTAVRSLVGRNAGRYRFLEAEVALRVDDLERAHAVSKRIEASIRSQVPHVERVLIHYEPRLATHVRYAVPLQDPAGATSDHFGEAPFLGLVTVRRDGWQVERQEVLANPHGGAEKAKGIRVAEWLVGLKIDAVLLREGVQGKGPAYVFADAGVEVRVTEATDLAGAIQAEAERDGM